MGIRKPVLLMAEDEEDTASLIKFLLERAGYQIIHAEDGRRMQTLIDEMSPPDIVLLDVMLPFLSGLQLLGHIRHKPQWEQVPVVMLTADGSERDMQVALQSGAQDYILKPFNPRELTTRLQRFLKQAA
jgi:DNA-binding response OmpR family regulator